MKLIQIWIVETSSIIQTTLDYVKKSEECKYGIMSAQEFKQTFKVQIPGEQRFIQNNFYPLWHNMTVSLNEKT